MVNPAQDWPDFTRAMLLVGVDASGDPVGILVDEDGNLNCILRGQGATGLQTIAVDENGRIEVFILDSESQWGQVLRVGNAELAARLGSPVSWDWRGNVLLINTFGAGQGAILAYAEGTGSVVQCSPLQSLTDGFSLLLQGGTGAEDYAGYDGRMGINLAQRLGFAIAWAETSQFDYLTIEVWGSDGANSYLGRLKWILDTKVLAYMDAAAAYQTIATAPAVIAPYGFNRVKLVVDLDAHEYLRVLWNGVEYDLSGLAMYTWTFSVPGTLGYKVRVYPGDLALSGVYVDHHIITVNEPENS